MALFGGLVESYCKGEEDMMRASEVWKLDSHARELDCLANHRMGRTELQRAMAEKYRKCPEKFLYSNFEMAKAILRGDVRMPA